MIYTVDGLAAYAYTGGKAFDPAQPTIAFIHGAQNDHSVWALQSRWFAHHGFNVLAVDLPGHGRSSGPALPSVEAMAGWLLRVLDAAGAPAALLAGHSMGSLIALEAASQAPARVAALAMLGTTYPMKVSDALLAMAKDDEGAAIDMVNMFSHARAHALQPQNPMAPLAGVSTMGVARRLMQRLSSINPAQLFYTDFNACNSYAHGEQAAQGLTCPVLFVFGARDMMTPARSTRLLRAAVPGAKTVMVDAGHALMAEQPDAVLDALREFADTVRTSTRS